MSRRSTVRATRLSGQPSSEYDRGGPLEPREQVSYWCHYGHETRPTFAISGEVPVTWPCHVCGEAAGPDPEAAPAPSRTSMFHKTPYEFLMMRRSPEEGEQLLEEALASLRAKRGRR